MPRASARRGGFAGPLPGRPNGTTKWDDRHGGIWPGHARGVGRVARQLGVPWSAFSIFFRISFQFLTD